MGLKKYESYGIEFLEIIDGYLKENKIEPIKITKFIDTKNETLSERYNATYELYTRNLSLMEISKLRGFTINTIIEHLSQSVKLGQLVDWSRFIDNPIIEEQILSAINEIGLEKLKPIKESLPEEISYEEIKLVIVKNELL